MSDYPENMPSARFAAWLGEYTRGQAYSPRTLYEWEKRGVAPPSVRVGRYKIYNTENVKAWLAQKQTAAAISGVQAMPRLRPLPTRKPTTAPSTTPSSTKASS